MNPSLKRKLKKIIAPIMKLRLKNSDISIISNNCWGGVFYDKHGLQYKSPTIGLYFFADDYLKFLNNLKYYLSLDVKSLNINDSKYKDVLLERHGENVLLGQIDDIEIVFLHYDSIDSAIKKWNKRRKRVSFDNIFIKCNDQNFFNESNFEELKKLNYPKLLITSNHEYKGDFVYFEPKFVNEGYVVNDFKIKYKKLGVYNIINKLKGE